MGEVLIRAAAASDAEGIAEAHVRSIRELCGPSYEASQIEAWASGKRPEIYLEAIAQKPFFVAVLDGSIVGFSQLYPETADVRAIYVRPDCARQGVGRQLLHAVEASARTHALTRLKVQATINAVPFYQAQGYVLDGFTTFMLKIGTALPCANMHKELEG